ncbi:MAG: hypothetical protein KC425_20110 [Anaerolineales bacterium]|nr:hypothetical protein [Anaerolineales bacterium]
MLLLVLGAAFFFSYRAQQQLEARTADLRTRVTGLEGELGETQTALRQERNTREETEQLLTAEQNVTLQLDQQLFASERRVEALAAELAEAQAAAQNASASFVQFQQQLQQAPPAVSLTVVPTGSVAVSQTVQVWVAAADVVGLSRVEVAIGAQRSSYLADGALLSAQYLTYTVRETGVLTISVQAVKSLTATGTPTETAPAPVAVATAVLQVVPAAGRVMPTVTALAVPETAVRWGDAQNGLVWQRQGEQFVVYWRQAWPTQAARADYQMGLAQYASARYGPEQRLDNGALCWANGAAGVDETAVCLYLPSDDSSVVVMASDLETAVAAVAGLP